MSDSNYAFTCHRCGHCCHGEGGIILAEHDQKRLATHLDMPVEALIERYGEFQNNKIRLITGPNGYCVFFSKSKGCSVHPARPDICRAWPFFRGNIIDELSWQLAMDYCPGINSKVTHADFVEEGKKYLQEHGLYATESTTQANALYNPENDTDKTS